MKKTHTSMILAALLAAAVLALSGCGGGGTDDVSSGPGGPGPAEPTVNLSWDPPDAFVDNTPLIPISDLDYYEIFMRPDPNFDDTDVEVAQVAAVADIVQPDGTLSKDLVRDFALDNLLQLTNGSGTYYVAVRAVGVNGMKSDFSAPVEWAL